LDLLSKTDPLTGLFNRRYFELNVKQKIDHINAAHDAVLPYLVLVDIDDFKKVNDTFGHPAGDIVLKKVGNILLENIKDTDLAARWGGEEFFLFLNLNSVQEAQTVSNALKAAVEKTNIVIEGSIINVTVSIGVVRMAGNDPSSFSTSYKLVDQALYQAKSEGRNQVVIVKEV
jgi:diguanylate cyclase (GGDEF)-like protein